MTKTKLQKRGNMKPSSDTSSDEEDSAQVRVCLKLANSVQDRTLEVPTQPIAVPADIGRKGLSVVLNHLLGRSIHENNDDADDASMNDGGDDEKLPPFTFEFILKGTNNRLLRKGVEKEARQHGVSLEEALTITYFPAANVPTVSSNDETLPDWISCLSDCTIARGGVGRLDDDDDDDTNFVFSGCYDGSVHMYAREKADNCKSTLSKINIAKSGTGPIKTMATSTDHVDGNKIWIASASLDHTLNIHMYEHANGKNNVGTLQSYGQCVQAMNGDMIPNVGNASMTSLDFAAKSNIGTLLASGNGDGHISIWNMNASANIINNDTISDKKRRKLSSTKKKNSKKGEIGKYKIMPTINLENAHSQSVSGLSWGNHHKQHQEFVNNKENNSNSQNDIKIGNGYTHLISGSWDHTIKLWDVEKQNCLLTLNGARVVSCLDTSYHSEGVCATGHPDCTIRLWDLRVNTNSKHSAIVVSDNTFRPSHKAWISNVQWSRSNAFQLASTSHDGCIKLWDIRSSNPLHTIRTFPKEEKGLSMLWLPPVSAGNNSTIYAGGTDCVMKQLEL